jgi:uncharacterized protein (DUF58 family)
MMRLTPTGWLFLGGSVLLYLAALSSQSGLLLLMVGILLGAFLVNGVSARQVVRKLDVAVPPVVRVCEGERSSHPWRISYRGRGDAGFIQAWSDAGLLFSLRHLPAECPTTLAPDLVWTKRGVYPHAALRLTCSYPFGLVRAYRRVDLSGEVIVGPAVYLTPTPRAAGYDVMLGGKFKGYRLGTSGASFAGVRPFQHGDPWKQIHWKSSAKGQGLMVKTFDEELSGRVSIILDGGASGNGRALDAAARAAGSLMFAVLAEGHHVELIDLDRLELAVFPPFADGQEILDRLARLTLTPGTLQADRLKTAVDRLSRRSAVCFVLTEFKPAVSGILDYLAERHRPVSLYLPSGVQPPEGAVRAHLLFYGEHEIGAGS